LIFGAAIVPQTPVITWAALGPAPEPHRDSRPKLKVALDGGGRAVAHLIENPFSILGAELVLQLVASDDAYLGPDLFADQRGDCLGELPRVDNADRIPGA
jgi:hypothetical protein